MTIPLEHALQIANSLQGDRIKNLFAQSHAKHVLLEMKESPENFPPFDRYLDDKVTFAAYSLLAAGCSLNELDSNREGIHYIETAASLLQNVHATEAHHSLSSAFHIIVASMAHYIAGHYSQAFVAIRNVECVTSVGGLIAAFLRKDIKAVIHHIASVTLCEAPTFERQEQLDNWVIEVSIARSMSGVIEYIFTGKKAFLAGANEILEDALIIAKEDEAPSQWWLVRLLHMMFKHLEDASLWRNLPQFFLPEPSIQIDRYIRLMAFNEPPVMELWHSQLEALSVALNNANRGGIINLRTSAGKTRIAELAMLQALCADPSARIIYLAPFRSLAFEIERTFSESLSVLGFQVSHIYGGARVSRIDVELIEESSVIIATPEKVRVLFRSVPSLLDNVKLVVVDEGHLIGPSERYIRNELFIDHLRSFSRSIGSRILLLSAVLPNSKQMAEWITGDQNVRAVSQWKPSAERYGILRWNGTKVRIDWIGDVESFNPSFVEAKPLGFGRRRNPFPNNKNEAIAASALRLSSNGPVMIFAGRAMSVPTLASAVLLGLGEAPKPHPWPEHEWNVFEAVCSEDLEENAIEVRAARAGVICHSNRLTPEVRMAIECLMRSRPPKIIIATTTLGQGVNIGISSVIIASPYIEQNPIKKRDFWNICGRAGRAFVDGEGKILYAIDEDMSKIERLRETDNEKWKEEKRIKIWQIRKDRKMAKDYFDQSTSDPIESGLLFAINLLRRISDKAGVTFEVLLELVANNDFSEIGDGAPSFSAILDLIDDELLSMNEDSLTNSDMDDSLDWVDSVFRESLAYIQARDGSGQSNCDDVLKFIRARTKSLLAGLKDKNARKAIVSSGLPLSVATMAYKDIDIFRAIADEIINSEKPHEQTSSAVLSIEEWARENALAVTECMPDCATLDIVRSAWLGGIGLRKITEIVQDAVAICRDLYGYRLSWLIHAISQNFDKNEEEERIKAFSRVALLVEIGVPNELAAKIFLSGIRSRVTATELSQLTVDFGENISTIKSNLKNQEFVESILSLVSEETAEWMRLMRSTVIDRRMQIPKFSPFTIKHPTKKRRLYARQLEKDTYLCEFDGSNGVKVKSSAQFPFSKIADDPRFVFQKKYGIWFLHSRDPRYEINPLNAV